jgi:hypothetical protein
MTRGMLFGRLLVLFRKPAACREDIWTQADRIATLPSWLWSCFLAMGTIDAVLECTLVHGESFNRSKSSMG